MKLLEKQESISWLSPQAERSLITEGMRILERAIERSQEQQPVLTKKELKKMLGIEGDSPQAGNKLIARMERLGLKKIKISESDKTALYLRNDVLEFLESRAK